MNRLLTNLINQLYMRQVGPCNRAKCSRLSQRDIKWLRYSVCALSYSQCCQIEKVATGTGLPALSSCYKMSGWGVSGMHASLEKCCIATGSLEKKHQTNSLTEIYQNTSENPSCQSGQRLIALLSHMSSSCSSHCVTQTEN